ncbi:MULTISPECIES: WXG100 family type VII secretion target [unclassified Cryobacterium]|jgi:WXG100 family type VII secretion target|uniref:WXG100 family type VII secretion target n=1 Tax=unclassified Cryobacterium TaxID=2649013 RepID=UPI00144542F6|nr:MULTISPECIES: WXG100 family type VII secretion target [unclassified Cryobacterium]
MANLNVTYDDLRDAAQRLLAGRDDLNAKLTELSNLVQNLTANGFQAEQSSAAYRDSYEQFTSGTRTAIDGLEGLSQFLVAAADALQQTDEGLANAIRG